MLSTNHPDDERLSAFAAGDADAVDASDGAAFTLHLAGCVRCQELVNDLRSIHAALGDLPDVAPPRPLRLLPPAEPMPDPAPDRLGGWARRFFAPILTAGAALALVGMVGTALPAFDQMASGGAASAEDPGTLRVMAASEAPAEAAQEAAESGAADLDGGAAGFGSASPPTAGTDVTGQAVEDEARSGAETPIPSERSPWPMVLFAGVTLMVAAVGMRWILAPRSGVG